MIGFPELPQLVAGETVTVLTPSVSYDGHMEQAVTWEETEVENVVVAPGTTTDVPETSRPDGTRAAFTLGFPKSFSAPLRSCHVIVRGAECAVIGDPQPLTPENTPGPWNLTAEVERVDG